jgi:hypothetical protein
MQDIAQSTGRFRQAAHSSPLKVRPQSAADIVRVLTDSAQFPSPVRPVGTSSGNSRCISAPQGTQLDMTGMNEFISFGRNSVTVQAGMRLRDLSRKLSESDLELIGCYENPDRSVGGVISSGSLSAGMPEDGGGLAASVRGIGLVTPEGRVVEFDASRPEMLRLVRQSFGLLGVIHSVTLRTRRTRVYSIRSRKFEFADLQALIPELAASNSGVKIYLLPFRDCVFMEMRESSDTEQKIRGFNWRLRNWMVNRALPDVVHSVGRAFSVGRIRDPLIDGFTEATQMLVNARFVDAGTNAIEQTGQFRKIGPSSHVRTCTWFFPARNFGAAMISYRQFCRRHYKVTGFRCDLPAICYRLPKDQGALLSPSFDGPVFALSIRTTQTRGWDNFLLDIARISSRFGGIPLFNQTQCFTAKQVATAYGKRLERFRSIRQRTDPANRLLNQFFAEHIG